MSVRFFALLECVICDGMSDSALAARTGPRAGAAAPPHHASNPRGSTMGSNRHGVPMTRSSASSAAIAAACGIAVGGRGKTPPPSYRRDKTPPKTAGVAKQVVKHAPSGDALRFTGSTRCTTEAAGWTTSMAGVERLRQTPRGGGTTPPRALTPPRGATPPRVASSHAGPTPRGGTTSREGSITPPRRGSIRHAGLPVSSQSSVTAHGKGGNTTPRGLRGSGLHRSPSDAGANRQEKTRIAPGNYMPKPMVQGPASTSIAGALRAGGGSSDTSIQKARRLSDASIAKDVTPLRRRASAVAAPVSHRPCAHASGVAGGSASSAAPRFAPPVRGHDGIERRGTTPPRRGSQISLESRRSDVNFYSPPQFPARSSSMCTPRNGGRESSVESEILRSFASAAANDLFDSRRHGSDQIPRGSPTCDRFARRHVGSQGRSVKASALAADLAPDAAAESDASSPRLEGSPRTPTDDSPTDDLRATRYLEPGDDFGFAPELASDLTPELTAESDASFTFLMKSPIDDAPPGGVRDVGDKQVSPLSERIEQFIAGTAEGNSLQQNSSQLSGSSQHDKSDVLLHAEYEVDKSNELCSTSTLLADADGTSSLLADADGTSTILADVDTDSKAACPVFDMSGSPCSSPLSDWHSSSFLNAAEGSSSSQCGSTCSKSIQMLLEKCSGPFTENSEIAPLLKQILRENAELRDKFDSAKQRIVALEDEQQRFLGEGVFDLVNVLRAGDGARDSLSAEGANSVEGAEKAVPNEEVPRSGSQ